MPPAGMASVARLKHVMSLRRRAAAVRAGKGRASPKGKRGPEGGGLPHAQGAGGGRAEPAGDERAGEATPHPEGARGEARDGVSLKLSVDARRSWCHTSVACAPPVGGNTGGDGNLLTKQCGTRSEGMRCVVGAVGAFLVAIL